jgi:hypothetical protein
VAEETIITNVGEDDRSSVASEATLLALVSAIEDLAKKAGINPASARAKVEKAAVDSTKINIKESKKYKEALEDKTKATKDATNALNTLASRSFGVVTAILGGAVGAGTNFVKTLIDGGDTLTDFAQHVPIIGSQLSLLTGMIDSAVVSFRELSGAGVSFGEGIFEARRMAAEASMSLERFSRVVTENSVSLALLGGNANEGARRFAQISKIVNDEFRGSLMNLGFELDEIAEFTGAYLNQQTRLGRAQRMDARQLAEGTQEYILQLDRLARITGRSREEISRDLDEQLKDRRIAALVRSMDEKAVGRMQGVLAGIEDADMKEAITEMIATGGVPLSEAGKGLISVIPGLSEASRALREGSITEEEFGEVLRAGAGDAEEFLRQNGYTAAALAAMGNDVYSLLPALARLTKFGEGSSDALREQQEALEREESALLNFGTALENLRTQFFVAVEPLLQPIVQGFSDVIEYLTQAPVIESFMTTIGNFVNTIRNEGISEALGQLVSNIGTALMKSAWTAITDGIKSLWLNTYVIEGMIAGIALLWGSQAVVSALAGTLIRSLGGGAGSAAGGAASAAGGLGRGAALSGLLGRVAGPAAIAALGYQFYDIYKTNRAMTPEEREENIRNLAEEREGAGLFQEDWTTQFGSPDIQTPQSAQQDAAEQARRNLIAEREQIMQEAMAIGMTSQEQQERLAEIRNQLATQTESTNTMIDLLKNLNTTMDRVRDIDNENLELQGYLAQIAAEQLAIEREIEKNTEGGSDISRGGLIRFGGGR